jgi:hypothetical protein
LRNNENAGCATGGLASAVADQLDMRYSGISRQVLAKLLLLLQLLLTFSSFPAFRFF